MKITPKQYAISLYEATRNVPEEEAGKIIKKFVEILKENNDLLLEKKIIEEYGKYYQKKKNISRIKIKSKEKISSDTMNEIIKNFKNQIEIKEEIDENILGGIVIEINEHILLDGTINKKLKTIEKTIK